MEGDAPDQKSNSGLVACRCCTDKIQSPESLFICGGTMSGKTFLTKELLLNREHLFDPVPREIIYCYTIWQKKFDELQAKLGDAIIFRQDVPTLSELKENYSEDEDHRILVLDDKLSLLRESAEGRNILQIFTIGHQHLRLNCILLTQSLFHSQIQREISLNCKIFIFFKNSRSPQQIKIFGSQILPGKTDYFMDAYNRATKQKHGYLFIHLDSQFMLKTHILPHEETVVYLAI